MRYDKSAGHAKVVDVDDELGVVFGYAIICTEGGQPYYDTQGDHIPERAMTKAWLDFAADSRMASEMHDGRDAGVVVGSMPFTTDLADALGVQTDRTGLLIAMRPDKQMLAKFRSGELTGFSIGGQRLDDEVVDA